MAPHSPQIDVSEQEVDAIAVMLTDIERDGYVEHFDTGPQHHSGLCNLGYMEIRELARNVLEAAAAIRNRQEL